MNDERWRGAGQREVPTELEDEQIAGYGAQ